MSVFTVFSLTPNPALAAKISAVYPNGDNYTFNASTWFVSDQNVTTAQVCEKLDIRPAGTGNSVVVRVEGYFGVSSTALWEWLKLKGAPP
jgi:hypothetical protein